MGDCWSRFQAGRGKAFGGASGWPKARLLTTLPRLHLLELLAGLPLLKPDSPRSSAPLAQR
jgi:hypothetical protein